MIPTCLNKGETQPERRLSHRSSSIKSIDSNSSHSNLRAEPSDTTTITASINIQDAYKRTRDVSPSVREIRKATLDAGFKSSLDAALYDCQTLLSTNQPHVIHEMAREGTLDALAEVFQEAGAFNRRSFRDGNMIGGSLCQLANCILAKEFEKLRKLEQLNYSLVHWDPLYLAAFNFDTIYLAMKHIAPNLVSLFESLANPISDLTPPNAAKERRYIVTTLAQLSHKRNNHTNFLQSFLSLYLAACSAPQRVIAPLNHIGVLGSHTSLLAHTNSAATAALKSLRELGSKGHAFIVVFDNLTFLSKVRDTRLFNSDEFLAMIAGYVLIPAPGIRRQEMFTREDVDTKKVAALSLMSFLPREQEFASIEKGFLALFADVLLRFAKRFPDILSPVDPDLANLPEVFPLSLFETPEIRPLRVYDADEGQINQLIEFLYTLQSDLGISEAQCIANMSLYCGDLLTCRNIRFSSLHLTQNTNTRGAQFRQAECSEPYQLRYIVTAMGMFHLIMSAVALLFRKHFMKPEDVGSLSHWITYLGHDQRTLWNDSDATKVKDFNQCLDLIDTVLDGYILSAICEEFCKSPSNVDQLRAALPRISAAQVKQKLSDLAAKFSTYGSIESVRPAHGSDELERDPCYANYFLFMQHALTMRLFLRAMRKGDSGLMMHVFSILTVYFQGSTSHQYAMECLRLTADLREIWSPRLRRYFLENCLVNLTGKPNAFLALDALNEHILREAKSTLVGNQTKASIEYTQSVKAPLTMLLSEIKRIVCGETETYGFDVHSTSVSAWADIDTVANKLLSRRHTKAIPSRSSRVCEPSVNDLYAVGFAELGSTEKITKLKNTYSSIEEDEDSGSDSNEDLDNEDSDRWSDHVESDVEFELME